MVKVSSEEKRCGSPHVLVYTVPALMARATPTGKQMDAPCCDVFELEDGKIKRFDCYAIADFVVTSKELSRCAARCNLFQGISW